MQAQASQTSKHYRQLSESQPDLHRPKLGISPYFPILYRAINRASTYLATWYLTLPLHVPRVSPNPILWAGPSFPSV